MHVPSSLPPHNLITKSKTVFFHLYAHEILGIFKIHRANLNQILLVLQIFSTWLKILLQKCKKAL